MTAEHAWVLGYVLGVVVVLVVALLLIGILLVASSIERLAGQALDAAGEIVTFTRPVWALGVANGLVEEIVGSVRSIESQVTTIADTLSRGTAADYRGGEA